MKSQRSSARIANEDLIELLGGSWARLREYFFEGEGRKWLDLYDINKPLAIALCQGAAMHYHDHINGVKDFDVWFLYPFNKKHLPYRTIWHWDYRNPKFGSHPDHTGYMGRKVDVLVRSIRNYDPSDPGETIRAFFENEGTDAARELALKAVVLLDPPARLGDVVWYKGPIA